MGGGTVSTRGHEAVAVVEWLACGPALSGKPEWLNGGRP
jgi:hypothetical protein